MTGRLDFSRQQLYTHPAAHAALFQPNRRPPMYKSTVLFLTCVLALAACDSEKPKTAPQSAEARADNPMLKLQDETVNKAGQKIDAGLQHTREQIDNADKQ